MAKIFLIAFEKKQQIYQEVIVRSDLIAYIFRLDHLRCTNAFKSHSSLPDSGVVKVHNRVFHDKEI